MKAAHVHSSTPNRIHLPWYLVPIPTGPSGNFFIHIGPPGSHSSSFSGWRPSADEVESTGLNRVMTVMAFGSGGTSLNVVFDGGAPVPFNL
jgi:hypothetical protein